MNGPLMISCRDATRMMVEREHRPLRTADRAKLRLHLMMCKWCRRFLTQMQFLTRAIRRLAGRRADSARLSDAARAHMRETIRREQSGPGA